MSETVSLDRKPNKKTQVVPVTKASGWQSSGDADANDKGVVTPSTGFDIGMLDFMSVEDFTKMMKTQTKDNYGSLWGASSQMAAQLKASKSLLTMNSYMTMGKTKNEILEKLTESMKFTLGADHVYIFEYAATCNSLVLTHSDNIVALQQKIPVSDGSVEGKLVCRPFYVIAVLTCFSLLVCSILFVVCAIPFFLFFSIFLLYSQRVL